MGVDLAVCRGVGLDVMCTGAEGRGRRDGDTQKDRSGRMISGLFVGCYGWALDDAWAARLVQIVYLHLWDVLG